MLYLLIFVILFLLEFIYFKIAGKFSIIDKPNLRSSHTPETLRGGGVVFLFGVWLYAVFFGWNYIWFLIGLTLIGLVSFVDDIHSLSVSVRLVVQFLAMIMMFHQLGIESWHDWWMTVIALIVCVGITNAFNFMDGINGITGAYSLAVLAPLVYLNTKIDFIEMPYLWVTGLSIVVFCFFNFRKNAIFFAGDVGPISIAFILIFALGKLILKTGDFAYIVLLALYGADSVFTICHRIKLHENLGEAHRKHAYQIMANELGISHVRISLIYMLLQLIISFGMIFCPINHYVYLLLIMLGLLIIYILFMKKNFHLHEEYLKSKAKNI